ncbi:hypothetical protein [Myroides injenensis]|uniref:hypothetical protein n=1 Tax=Myroides injenensis TaxID=1183151 RepID=UPI0002883E2D|nr:hypothetical protein [Myroides injenensis]
MVKKIIPLVMLSLSLSGLAQERTGETTVSKTGVGIGVKVPSKSAQLEVGGEDKGILIPRLDLVDAETYLGSDLAGASKVTNIGMLVYHKNSKNTELPEGFYSWTGTKWDRITSQSELTKVILETKTEMVKEIEKITEIVTPGEPGENGEPGKDADLSYMVVYSPSTDKLSYLEKKKGENGELVYEQKEITFGELVQQQETNTFFKEKKEILEGETKETLTGYIYYSEKAITDWLEGGKNVIADIPDDNGFTIDVLASVKENIETVIKASETIIQEVIKEADGTVRVQEVNGKLVLQYKPAGEKDYVNVDLSGVETVTSIDKFVWDEGEKVFKSELNTEPPLGEKGKIYYKYQGEKNEAGQRVTQYIDLSSDIVQAIKNDTTIQESISNTVNQHFETIGGNVFYGAINNDDSKEYLYVVEGEEKNKVKIDISESVKEVFDEIIKGETKPGETPGEDNNNEIVNSIKNAIGLKVLTDKPAVDTGNTIDSKKVFKQSVTINVDKSNEDPSVNTDFVGNIVVANFGTLLNVSIYDETGVLVCSNVTDVVQTTTSLKFSFGQGNLYTPLETGYYTVVFEYVSNIESKTDNKK